MIVPQLLECLFFTSPQGAIMSLFCNYSTTRKAHKYRGLCINTGECVLRYATRGLVWTSTIRISAGASSTSSSFYRWQSPTREGRYDHCGVFRTYEASVPKHFVSNANYNIGHSAHIMFGKTTIRESRVTYGSRRLRGYIVISDM